MDIALATICFVFAIVTTFYAVVTEYRQTRANGPVAMVGTMQWSPAAAVFSLLGLDALPISLPGWCYPAIFLAVLLLSGWAIMRRGKRCN
jgi:hypothetical protein